MLTGWETQVDKQTKRALGLANLITVRSDVSLGLEPDKIEIENCPTDDPVHFAGRHRVTVNPSDREMIVKWQN